MNEDQQNYQDEQIKQEQSQSKYKNIEQPDLNSAIHFILSESQKSKTLFPPQLSKKICQANGLQCNEESFFSLLSNIVEYSLNDIINSNKQIKQTGKYKKQGKDNQLKTVQIQKYLESKNIFYSNPRCYPELSFEKDKNNTQNLESSFQ